MQNGFVESFNGRLRDECLNEQLFTSLREAREIIEEWRIDYNTNRPHTSLDGLTPNEFAARPTRGITGTDFPYKRGHTGEQVRAHWKNRHGRPPKGERPRNATTKQVRGPPGRGGVMAGRKLPRNPLIAQCQAAHKIGAQRRSAALPSTINKNYLRCSRDTEGRLGWRPLFLAAKRYGPSERLVVCAATNAEFGGRDDPFETSSRACR